MKVVKFKDERGNDRYGLRKRVWTWNADIYCGHVFYDFSENDWNRTNRMYTNRYMRESAQEVIEKYDEIILRAKREKEQKRTKSGVVLDIKSLRKQLEEKEEDEVQDNRHERWGVNN